MGELTRTFVSVSETKDWIVDRISTLKSKLDDRQSALCRRLEEMGAELDSGGARGLSEELDKLRLYRQETVSLFGESTQNISVIDGKISDLENRISEQDKISVSWGGEELNKLISSLGDIVLTPHTPPKSTPVLSRAGFLGGDPESFGERTGVDLGGVCGVRTMSPRLEMSLLSSSPPQLTEILSCSDIRFSRSYIFPSMTEIF